MRKLIKIWKTITNAIAQPKSGITLAAGYGYVVIRSKKSKIHITPALARKLAEELPAFAYIAERQQEEK
jgi:hypothetical protein